MLSVPIVELVDAGKFKALRIDFHDGHIGPGEPPNLFIIPGKPLTLIDAGIGSDKNFLILDEALFSAGYKMADIEQVIITHWHWDHTGLTSRIAELSEADFIAHACEIPRLTGSFEEIGKIIEVIINFYKINELPADFIEELNATARSHIQPSIQLNRIVAVSNGDTIQAGDIKLRVIHSPGHTPGSICLFEEEGRVLFGSDTLYGRLFPHPVAEVFASSDGVVHSVLREYPETLLKLKSLSPVLCLPGHGRTFPDAARVIDILFKFIERRSSRISRLLETASRPLNAGEILKIMFPDISRLEMYPAAAEVLLLLEVTEKKGITERVQLDNGLPAFRKKSLL